MTMRVHKRQRFTSVPNNVINNPNLSWGAIGLLAFLHSKEEGKIATKEEILGSCTNSEQEVDSLILELEREVAS